MLPTGKQEFLNKVTAQAYTSKYNYYTRDYEPERWKTFITDVNGYFEVPAADDYHYFWIDFSYGNDRFVNEQGFLPEEL